MIPSLSQIDQSGFKVNFNMNTPVFLAVSFQILDLKKITVLLIKDHVQNQLKDTARLILHLNHKN